MVAQQVSKHRYQQNVLLNATEVTDFNEDVDNNSSFDSS